MNCKPGDLALIVGPLDGPNCYRLVRCIRLLRKGESMVLGDLEFYPVPHGEFWAVEGRLVAEVHGEPDRDVPGGPIGDRWLRPIRPGAGEDETIEWAGKPEKVAA